MNRRSLLVGFGISTFAGAALPVMANAGNAPVDVLDAYLAAWNAHNSAEAASHFADNVVYYDASVGSPITGRGAAKTGVIDNFLNAVPDAIWTMVGTPIVQGDKLAFEWKFSGTNSGNWADGTKATGKTFSFTGASVFKIGDGMIQSQSDYYDALGFYKQLGLM